MKKNLTYLKNIFNLCFYQSILFLFFSLLQNDILQSVSNNYRGKGVNKGQMKTNYRINQTKLQSQ